MAWLPHGPSKDGLIFSSGEGRSASVPAVSTYRGRLWCLWTDPEGRLWYARTGSGGDEEQFGERAAFPQAGLPVLANLNGVLHAVLAQSGSGRLAHYVHDDDDAATEWTCLEPELDAGAGFVAQTTPAVVAFHNKLFLAFLRDGQLHYSIWSALGRGAQRWARPQPVAGPAAAVQFRGIPALFVIGGVLHLLCGADTAERHILGYRYDYIGGTWAQSDDVSEGRAASGVSAVSFGSEAYLGIIEAGPGDESHAVYVAAFRDGAWDAHEAVAGASAADPPQIAMLNGRVHCIFNDHSARRDLRWYSRPVLRYALTSWMGQLPDDVPISQLTVPGTHDSCARSSIPFVRTQYLSIPQQLALGIRFFDLRLRRHKDGKLYCYHGGVPIDMPRGLAFDTVMQAIWQFLWPATAEATATPTETVLVSINNDDKSREQKAHPEVFYHAVADAIAATPPWPANGAHRWHVEPVTPTLGAVRGRAVLLRRYLGDEAVAPAGRQGLDLSAWLDDNPDFTLVTPTQVRLRLQDKWKYAERIALHDLVASKAGFVQAMMKHASGGGDEEEEEETERHEWYLNFCSAVGDPAEHGEIAEAKWIAVGAHSDFIGKWVSGMNVRMREHLQTQYAPGQRARLGVVNLDYPELPEDNDLVARLIETNFGSR